MENTRVLVVEDESSIRKFITLNLKRNNFDVIEAESGEKALELIKKEKIKVFILDVMLPGIDGFEVCEKIRTQNSDAIIIMLTARGQDMDKIMGLELGADDYMVKPFNPLELIARIRAILRRTEDKSIKTDHILVFGKLKLDVKSQKFYKDNKEIELTPKEYAIIKMFMSDPGKALSRDDILNLVWGEDYFGDVKTVDVNIRRLREKIEDDPSHPEYLQTVWGYGYRWEKEN